MIMVKNEAIIQPHVIEMGPPQNQAIAVDE